MHGHALLISAVKNGIYSNRMFISCAPELQRHAPFFARHFKGRAVPLHADGPAVSNKHQWHCSGSSKWISRFHYQKNFLHICTTRLSPNQQHELEQLRICFCGDISQIMMGVVEVHYRVPLHYLTVVPKQTKKILGRRFVVVVSFCLFCKRSGRFVFKISC